MEPNIGRIVPHIAPFFVNDCEEMYKRMIDDHWCKEPTVLCTSWHKEPTDVCANWHKEPTVLRANWHKEPTDVCTRDASRGSTHGDVLWFAPKRPNHASQSVSSWCENGFIRHQRSDDHGKSVSPRSQRPSPSHRAVREPRPLCPVLPSDPARGLAQRPQRPLPA